MSRIGVYVHIPFCAGKCFYCNFYSLAGRDGLIPRYQEALLKQIGERRPLLSGYDIDTVYFGGGTPSHYGASRLAGVLGALTGHGNVLPGAEITVEANPESATAEGLSQLRAAGFNRVSIGVQCADDGILAAIGRLHSFADAVRAIGDARRAGFGNVSVDIIYGLPSQSLASWADTVERVAALGADHISCYGLKVEESTQLYDNIGDASLPDDDAQADMYLFAADALARYGYEHYEISNFAMPGFESRHNMRYWLGGEYMGFGPGAHSFMTRCRFSFVQDAAEYIRRAARGLSVVDRCEWVSDTESAAEYLMLRLRTARGISEREYFDLFGFKFDFAFDLLRDYEKRGWARYEAGRWRLTPGGFLISNVLIGNLLESTPQM